MNKSNDIKENFAALLRDSLRSRFGRIPSAAVVAREFNLRAYDTPPISQESARRWMRGVSLPEEQRLRVLVNWLNLDFNAALRPGRDLNGRGLLNGHAVSGQSPSLHANNGNAANGHASNGHVNNLDQFARSTDPRTGKPADLGALLQHLNADQRQVLEGFLRVAFKNPSSPL
jgi:hypothetical protein